MAPQGFTDHAWKRISSRRIPKEGIEAAIMYGRRYWNQGREVYRLDRRSVQHAKKQGFCLRQYEGIHVILGESGEVVTAYRNRTCKRLPR